MLTISDTSKGEPSYAGLQFARTMKYSEFTWRGSCRSISSRRRRDWAIWAARKNMRMINAFKHAMQKEIFGWHAGNTYGMLHLIGGPAQHRVSERVPNIVRGRRMRSSVRRSRRIVRNKAKAITEFGIALAQVRTNFLRRWSVFCLWVSGSRGGIGLRGRRIAPFRSGGIGGAAGL